MMNRERNAADSRWMEPAGGAQEAARHLLTITSRDFLGSHHYVTATARGQSSHLKPTEIGGNPTRQGLPLSREVSTV